MSSVSALASSLRENEELIGDLCRYAEGVLTEKQVRQKWHLADDAVWESLGTDDAYVERVELERVRRIRSGAAKREKAQLHVVAAPDVLSGILKDPKANARHRIDSAKALDDLAGFAPQRPGVEQDRVIIRIDLSADTKDPADVLTFEAAARPQPSIDAAPQERVPLIEADNRFDQGEVIPLKRGRGRPRGSKNKPKLVEHESKSRGLPGFDVG
jgi:hypothetical protein